MSMIDDFDDAAQTSLPFVNTFATEALQIHEAVFSRVSKLPGFVDLRQDAHADRPA